MKSRPLAIATLFITASWMLAADWPQWRGPDRTGVSKESGLLKTWPKEGPKLLWTFKNAGEGFSSFAVVGDTVYTFGTRGGDEVVLALDVGKGTEKWSAKIGPIFNAFGNWGHGPRSTPTIDGTRLYALGSQGDLVCLDLKANGKEVWRKSLPKDFGGEMMSIDEKMSNWGYSESPLVDGQRLVCTPGGEKGLVVALDKEKGALIWQSAELKNKAPYSSIMPAEISGVRQYIQNSFVPGTGGFVSGVAAKDGKILWTMPTFKGPECYNIAPTPIVRDNLAYVTVYDGTTLRGNHCFEIDAKFKAKDLYSKDSQSVMKNNHGGVVLIGDHVYGHSDRSGWICQEFKTGKLAWKAPDFLECKSGAITAADGRLYAFTDEGEVGLIDANPNEFKAVGSFKLPEKSTMPATIPTSKDGKIWSHPVVSGGRLLLRDHELIFCFDVKAK